MGENGGLDTYDKNKNLKFSFCKIRDVFVLYIPRTVVRGKIFKVNFIADGKIVIDPTFRSDYDKSGRFYNIIDFRQIEENEYNYALENSRIVKYYGQLYKKSLEYQKEMLEYFSKNHMAREETNENSSSNDDFTEEAKTPNKNRRNSKRNFTGGPRRSMDFGGSSFTKKPAIKSGSGFPLFQLGKFNNTHSNLNYPKSILRSPGTSRNSLGSKRVSFSGKVEIVS